MYVKNISVSYDMQWQMLLPLHLAMQIQENRDACEKKEQVDLHLIEACQRYTVDKHIKVFEE